MTFKERFFQPVDNCKIELFRILLGFLMTVESFGAIATGWVRRTLVEPEFTFNFMGFEWLQMLQGEAMYAYFVVMGFASIGMMIGYKYRFMSIAVAILWSGAYYMQKASYNNHYYLMVLILWFMASISASKNYSVDARQKGAETTCPAWYNWFLMFNFFIVFTFASVNKFYPGWQEGHFIRNAFNYKADYWLIGPLLGADWFQQLITFGGIFFDLLVVPALFWKPTRNVAFAGLVFFNLFNSVVFQIGIFPYLVLAFAAFFYESSTIRKLFFKNQAFEAPAVAPNYSNAWTLPLVFFYFVIQIALPLRHHLIPGDVNWREEGHRLSWRMMLRSKSGYAKIDVVDAKTGKRYPIDLKAKLSKKQYQDVATKPDFIYQYAQQLKTEFAAKNIDSIQIFMYRSDVYLNGAGPHPLVSRHTDLAKVKWNYWGRNEWVLDRPD